MHIEILSENRVADISLQRIHFQYLQIETADRWATITYFPYLSSIFPATKKVLRKKLHKSCVCLPRNYDPINTSASAYILSGIFFYFSILLFSFLLWETNKHIKEIPQNPHTILHFGDGILEEAREGPIGRHGLSGLTELMRWRLHRRRRRDDLFGRIEDRFLSRLRGGRWGHEHRVRPDFSDHRRRRGLSVDSHCGNTTETSRKKRATSQAGDWRVWKRKSRDQRVKIPRERTRNPSGLLTSVFGNTFS